MVDTAAKTTEAVSARVAMGTAEYVMQHFWTTRTTTALIRPQSSIIMQLPSILSGTKNDIQSMC
eukprot:2684394-Karenia_brevis.AAC.1